MNICFRLKEEEERKNQMLSAASKPHTIGIAAGALPDEYKLKRQVVPPKYITNQLDDQAQTSKER